MRITVRTIPRLGGHLAADTPGDPDHPDHPGTLVAHDTAAGATPTDVMRELGLSPERNYLVKVNGGIVPQARHGTARLKSGDEMTILPKPKYG